MTIKYDRKQKIIDLIKKSVTDSAHQARENAGYAGRMDDGGASEKERKLMYWLDGVEYAKSGVTNIYSNIVNAFERSEDPEYKEFLRLKDKFKD